MNEILRLLAELDAWQYLVVAANLALMIFARPLLGQASNIFSAGPDNGSRRATERNASSRLQLTLLRGVNLLILAVILYPTISQNSATFALRLAQIAVVIYLAYLFAVSGEELILRRYGRLTGADSGQYSDTYRSRMLSLLLSSFVAIAALITIIRLAGFASLLEAGGVIGFIGVFLALTQAAWAPDIISGLLLLNSEMVSEGDVIEFTDSEPLLARVFKTKIFHTVLVDVVDNHRVMIRNSRLRDFTIHNLSRFASARGLREKMTFKIGYDVSTDNVRNLFEEAYASVCDNEDIAIDQKHPLEIRVLDTGDHAVEWGVFYYIKDIVQKVRTRQLFIEEILQTSVRHNISLSTPQTHVVSQVTV